MNSSQKEMDKFEVFKNPLDIPRDELIRNLIHLPVQVAAELDSCCAQVRGQRKSTMKTPLIRVLECHISKQERSREVILTEKAEEPNYNKLSSSTLLDLYSEEKNGGINEAWLEGEYGPLPQQQTQECNLKSQVEHGSVLSDFKSMVGAADVLASEITLQSTSTESQHDLLLSKTSSEARSKVCLSVCSSKKGLETEGTEQGVGVIYGSNKRKRDFDLELKFKENSANEASAEYNFAAIGPSPVVRMEKEQTEFLISLMRIIRNSKPQQSKELFDILSSSNLPMKEHLLEQLIWMAKEYNKKTLVGELMKYKDNCSCEAEKRLSCASVS